MMGLSLVGAIMLNINIVIILLICGTIGGFLSIYEMKFKGEN